MIPVVAYWYNDLGQLQCKLPLSTLGRHAAKHGFADVPIHLLCLRGPEFPEPLRRELEEYGLVFHDGREIFTRRAAEFAAFKQECPPIFFEGFLRWLVMGDYFKGQALVSLDADIFLNIKMSELLKCLDGVTGTATSTCFVPISNPTWFEIIESELRALQSDKAAYLRKMRQEMASLLVGTPEKPEHETVFGLKAYRALGSEVAWREHFDFTPEELLVDYLIRSQKLPQDPWLETFPYLVCTQFLVLPDLAWVTPVPPSLPPRLETPIQLTHENGVYAMNKRRMAFIHLQGANSRLYASKLVLQHFFAGVTDNLRIKSDLHPGNLPAPTTTLFLDAYRRISEANPNDPRVREFCAKHADPFNETQLSEKLMLELSLNEIFNPVISDTSGLWAE